MAESENTTKVEEELKDIADGEGEDLLSLESLDSVLAEADPEFAKALNEIGPDEGLSIYEEGLELQFTLEDEKKKWQHATGIKAKLLKVMPFLPWLGFHIKMKRTMMRLSLVKFKQQSRENIKAAGPTLLKALKGGVQSLKHGLGDGLSVFKAYSLVKKLMFVALIIATGVGAFVIYRTATHGLVPQNEELFIGSLGEWAATRYQFNPKNDVESFYESTRASQNIIVTKKLVVNLKRSQESGLNPMGAFEFFVEGAAAEVIVEFKDREFEVNDLFLRTIEDMSYDQMASAEGKQLLCERLRKEVNKILTKGYVRKVYIKTAIIKP